MDAIDRLIKAFVDANSIPTPRAVARQHGATIFHLSVGGTVTVRGKVDSTWEPMYWQPMVEAVQAGHFHPAVRQDGTNILVLEVAL